MLHKRYITNKVAELTLKCDYWLLVQQLRKAKRELENHLEATYIIIENDIYALLDEKEPQVDKAKDALHYRLSQLRQSIVIRYRRLYKVDEALRNLERQDANNVLKKTHYRGSEFYAAAIYQINMLDKAIDDRVDNYIAQRELEKEQAKKASTEAKPQKSTAEPNNPAADGAKANSDKQ